MGRHRKKVDDNGNVRKQERVISPNQTVEDRLGLNDAVCSKCNARNPPDAEKCRKCNATHLRAKASQYRDE